MNHAIYADVFHQHDVRITINHRLLSAQEQDDKLVAIIGSDYTKLSEERFVDQIIVEHGTLPLDEIYFDLKSDSTNGGEVDYQALLQGAKQSVEINPDGKYQLFRIGDAASSRNIHAAIYDAFRLCKDM
jgi:hypothetical protein